MVVFMMCKNQSSSVTTELLFYFTHIFSGYKSPLFIFNRTLMEWPGWDSPINMKLT